MRTEDIKKLVKAGYKIIMAIEVPRYAVFQYNRFNDEWDILRFFSNKKQLDEYLEDMLKDEKTILD